MRTGAMVLGIIGGILGLIIGTITLALGTLAGGVGSMAAEVGSRAGGETATAGREAETAGMILFLWGFLVFAFAVAGLVGGALARARPLAAGILMLVGGAGGFMIGWFWLFCGVLLIIGGILAIAGRKEIEKEVEAVQV